MNKTPAYKTALDVVFIIVLVIASWWLATDVFGVLPSRIFPGPGAVFSQIVEDGEKILTGIVSSLGIIAQGFVLGAACGIGLGLLLGSQARVHAAAEKVVAFLSAIPPIVYIPYGIALLPTFRASSVLVIFLATFWPVLTGTLAGVSSVDKRLIDSARVLNVPRP